MTEERGERREARGERREERGEKERGEGRGVTISAMCVSRVCTRVRESYQVS